MENLKYLLESLPNAAKDVKLNLANVLSGGSLSEAQRLGVSLACAFAARNDRLKTAILADAAAHLGDAWIDDAKAVAALMSMNNVFYRTRHMIGKPSYEAVPARLRMNRMAHPLTSKLDFELMSLAVSAVNGCEMCVRSHERSLLGLGASELQVNDAVRIAASVFAAAISLELEPVEASETP